MTLHNSLDRKEIQRRAVLIGQSRGLNAEAGRLEACDPTTYVDQLINNLRPDAGEVAGQDIIMDALAARLWVNWMAVEYRMPTVLEGFARNLRANVA